LGQKASLILPLFSLAANIYITPSTSMIHLVRATFLIPLACLIARIVSIAGIVPTALCASD
jgi:hypothetical protein